MKTTLVIMAAGIGSRFGGGIKQLAPVGLNGEIIMDYSIHDAIEAGFNKIVFIIRKDIKNAFKEAIGDRIEKICNNLDVEIAYAYQELSELPEGVELPAGRTKPWGTGQAVLACKEVLHEPFAVINADDYYGKEAFVKLHDFLVGYAPEKANQFCMAGFILKNTLSENGAVTRGICETNEEGYLTAVHETSNIVKTPEGAAVDNDGQLTSINAESYASMNMWGLTPEFMQTLEDGFKEFFANMGDKDILKAEYLLPIYIDELLQAGRVSVKVLDTNDKWFGVTYKEDKDYVVKSFAKIIEIFNKIAYNVLSALYQPFWAAVLLAFLTMFLYLYGKEHGWKKNNFIRNMLATWWRTFKNSSTFRRIFLLAFYTAMILLRTVLNREIWFDPLGKIFGGWGLYEDGQFTTESIENFMLFVPFSILLLWTFQKELLGESENIRFGKTVWEATKVVAIFSFMIEFTQLLFHLGTFQISDLTYNTLGGAVGGVIYYLGYSRKRKK